MISMHFYHILAAGLDVAALRVALVNLAYTGTTITFDSLLVSLSSVTVFDLNALFRLPVALPLPMAGFGTLGLVLRAFIAEQWNIPIAELDVEVYLQEQIIING